MSGSLRMRFVHLVWPPALFVFAACGPPADKQSEPLASVESAAGDWLTQTLSRPVESPHPYRNDSSFERRVEAPAGATAIRLQVRIRTERDYDFIEFANLLEVIQVGSGVCERSGVLEHTHKRIGHARAGLLMRTEDAKEIGCHFVYGSVETLERLVLRHKSVRIYTDSNRNNQLLAS